MNNLSQVSDSIFNNIRSILEDARSRAYRSVNFIMVEVYWNIGRIIVKRLDNTIRPELTRTHYCLLLRIENPQARSFYMNESANNGWSTRELDRS